jgi:hypothetical protein
MVDTKDGRELSVAFSGVYMACEKKDYTFVMLRQFHAIPNRTSCYIRSTA